jgi:hypothetical protein
MAKKSDLVEVAKDKLQEVIQILNIACKSDENAKAYIVDHLKIICSEDHGFCSRSLNLDNLIERYEGDNTDVGGDKWVYGDDDDDDYDQDDTGEKQ